MIDEYTGRADGMPDLYGTREAAEHTVLDHSCRHAGEYRVVRVRVTIEEIEE